MDDNKQKTTPKKTTTKKTTPEKKKKTVIKKEVANSAKKPVAKKPEPKKTATKKTTTKKTVDKAMSKKTPVKKTPITKKEVIKEEPKKIVLEKKKVTATKKKKVTPKKKTPKPIKKRDIPRKIRNPLPVIIEEEIKPLFLPDDTPKQYKCPVILITISTIIVYLILIFAVSIIYINFFKVDLGQNDALFFKEDYEALNGKNNPSNGKKYPEVKLTEDNIIDYVTETEAITMLESGTGILYMGFDSCPWCRILAPELLEIAVEEGLDKIAYLDIKNIRSSLKLNEHNEMVILQTGTSGYYKMLTILDQYLQPYTLQTPKDATGKSHQVSTGEKRIYAPTLIFIKEGKIVEFSEGVLDGYSDPYEKLTEEERKEIHEVLRSYIAKIK